METQAVTVQGTNLIDPAVGSQMVADIISTVTGLLPIVIPLFAVMFGIKFLPQIIGRFSK